MTSDAGADYQRVVRDALDEYRLTNFAEAYALFEQAHQLQPSARTWRCLGMTSFELRQYVRAQAELRAALSDTREPLTPVQHSEIMTLLDRVSRYVAPLEVRTTPSSASVVLDGQPVTGMLTVNLGEHELYVRADGYRPVLRKVLVEGGKPLALEIDLLPLVAADVSAATRSAAEHAASQPPSAAPPEAAHYLSATTKPAPRDRPWVERWWFWTAVGVVAAGSVVAVVLLTAEREPRKPEPGTVGGITPALEGRW